MYLILFFLFIVRIWCYPQQPVDQIIYQKFVPLESSADGTQSYSYSFKTSNGIFRSEQGNFHPDSNEGLSVSGKYSYVGPDGRIVEVNYIGDINGFRIQPNVPTRLRIPSAALASLAG